MLLTVTPVEVQIHDLLTKSLRIFDDEVKRKDIALEFQVPLINSIFPENAANAPSADRGKLHKERDRLGVCGSIKNDAGFGKHIFSEACSRKRNSLCQSR